MSLEKDPYVYRIRSIHKVVDGDTIDADIDLGFDISLTKRIRLAGVDTPESRTADSYEKGDIKTQINISVNSVPIYHLMNRTNSINVRIFL